MCKFLGEMRGKGLRSNDVHKISDRNSFNSISKCPHYHSLVCFFITVEEAALGHFDVYQIYDCKVSINVP